MIHPVSALDNTAISYLPKFRKTYFLIYWLALLLTTISLISLPFIYTTISITAQGITRPLNERTEIKSVVGGIIDVIKFSEGQQVKKGDTLLTIKDQGTKSKKIYNNYEINLHKTYIKDLLLLTSKPLEESLIKNISSPLYKEQLRKFLRQKAEQDISLKKAASEYGNNTTLFNEKVITKKEYFDSQVVYDKLMATKEAFTIEQKEQWQQDLSKFKLELSQLKEDRNQVDINASYYQIRIPVSGTLQGINNRYPGGLVQPNETLCTISPNGIIIAECYINTKDIGLIRLNQKVEFQIDAFDYKYFGLLDGKVIAIDNDFSTLNNSTFFKVRCQFNKNGISLKNGFTGKLQKGLSFQARFIIGRRSLWQLLWDSLDDWLNPSAPKIKAV